MKYTAQVCQAYPCAEVCEEVLDQLELLKDALVHKVKTEGAFTSNCKEIFNKYGEAWYKVQDLFHEIYNVDNLILWNFNQFGEYTLYETAFAVDDVYFINNADIKMSDDVNDPYKNMSFNIVNVDEIDKVKQVVLW